MTTHTILLVSPHLSAKIASVLTKATNAFLMMTVNNKNVWFSYAYHYRLIVSTTLFIF